MTVTVTLPARPVGIGQRHRVVAIASGLVRLTVTKALKLSELNITDAAVFLTRMTAQGTSHLVNQTPHWAPVMSATTVLGGLGVIITLSVAVVADLTKHVMALRNYRWKTSIGSAGSVALCHPGLRRARPMVKGWL